LCEEETGSDVPPGHGCLLGCAFPPVELAGYFRRSLRDPPSQATFLRDQKLIRNQQLSLNVVDEPNAFIAAVRVPEGRPE
jgi:hypothetical protein